MRPMKTKALSTSPFRLKIARRFIGFTPRALQTGDVTTGRPASDRITLVFTHAFYLIPVVTTSRPLPWPRIALCSRRDHNAIVRTTLLSEAHSKPAWLTLTHEADRHVVKPRSFLAEPFSPARVRECICALRSKGSQ
jgi:hypothetical protein